MSMGLIVNRRLSMHHRRQLGLNVWTAIAILSISGKKSVFFEEFQCSLVLRTMEELLIAGSFNLGA